MESFETTYVKNSYNQIAKGFSESRYKQWSSVIEFINSLHPNSYILDAGCGNGKNMTREDVKFIGCDICENLIEICKQKGLDVLLSNVTQLPFNDNTFDAVMSIAVLHHIYKKDDLITALNEIIRVVVNGGRIYFTVWAREQTLTNKFIPIDDQGNYFVTWKDKMTRDVVSKRFYHLFTKMEVDDLLTLLPNIKIINVSYKSDNWCVELQKN